MSAYNDLSVEKLREETALRWKMGNFIEQVEPAPLSVENELDARWVPYETYMKALLLKAIPGEVGVLLVEFPPLHTEDNVLHYHLESDRRITVLRGSGVFIAERLGVLGCEWIKIGDVIHMPRGTLHTFASTDEGMLIESFHAPYVDI